MRPDWHQSYRLEGEIDDLEGHVDAAIVNYQRALELGSTNANTVRRVVILLFQQNRMDEVQAALKHVGRDSSNPRLEKINVESKFRTGDREVALQMAKESVASLPDDAKPEDAATAHVWYGKLLETDNHPEEAEQEYRAAPGETARIAIFVDAFDQSSGGGRKECRRGRQEGRSGRQEG